MKLKCSLPPPLQHGCRVNAYFPTEYSGGEKTAVQQKLEEKNEKMQREITLQTPRLVQKEGRRFSTRQD